jgi:hypothetical protein
VKGHHVIAMLHRTDGLALCEGQLRQSRLFRPDLAPECDDVVHEIRQLAQTLQQPYQHDGFPIGGGIDLRLHCVEVGMHPVGFPQVGVAAGPDPFAHPVKHRAERSCDPSDLAQAPDATNRTPEPGSSRSLSRAMLLETLCWQYLLALSAGRPRLLTEQEMLDAQERFKTYGPSRQSS